MQADDDDDIVDSSFCSNDSEQRRGKKDETRTLWGLSTILVRLESRLPVPLTQKRIKREEGVWHSRPPPEIGAYSVAVFSASSAGVFGRFGVRWRVEYECVWSQRRACFSVSFESLSFGRRREFRCKEDNTDDQVFHISIEHGVGSDERPSYAVGVVVELREQVAGHLVLLPSHTRSTFCAGSISLRGGRLSSLLEQTTRSALVRIVNLTRRDLCLNDDDVRQNTSGFWIASPPKRLCAMSLADVGLAAANFLTGVRTTVSYVIEAPKTREEESSRICLKWQSPWVGRRWVGADDKGEYFVLSAHCDSKYNLVGVVHIVQQDDLPNLEVLSAVILGTGENSTGVDATKIIRQHMMSPFELYIPTVQNFYGEVARRRGKESSETSGAPLSEASRGADLPEHPGPLCVSYRIGPEAFSRTFMPNDKIHLSSALPGGDGQPSTMLAAVEAYVAEESSPVEQVLGSLAERALVCQRILTGALSAVIIRAMEANYGHDWSREVSLPDCFRWAKAQAGSNCMEELDAEGALWLLRNHWTKVITSPDLSVELLDPIDDLVTAWSEQVQLDNIVLQRATISAGALLRATGFDGHALEMEALCAGNHTSPTSSWHEDKNREERRKRRSRRTTATSSSKNVDMRLTVTE